MTRVFLFIFIFSLLIFLITVIANIAKIDTPRTLALLSYIANVIHREQPIDSKEQGGGVLQNFFIFCLFSDSLFDIWDFFFK